jgi:hypothetical protein
VYLVHYLAFFLLYMTNDKFWFIRLVTHLIQFSIYPFLNMWVWSNHITWPNSCDHGRVAMRFNWSIILSVFSVQLHLYDNYLPFFTFLCYCILTILQYLYTFVVIPFMQYLLQFHSDIVWVMKDRQRNTVRNIEEQIIWWVDY